MATPKFKVYFSQFHLQLASIALWLKIFSHVIIASKYALPLPLCFKHTSSTETNKPIKQNYCLTTIRSSICTSGIYCFFSDLAPT